MIMERAGFPAEKDRHPFHDAVRVSWRKLCFMRKKKSSMMRR